MNKPIEGLRVLIVEDEPFIAILLEDMLEDLGCVVADVAPRVPVALRLLDKPAYDLAILDVNVAGDRIDPVALRLTELGCHFMFSTGYGAQGPAEAWRDKPVLTKPFHIGSLRQAITAALKQT